MERLNWLTNVPKQFALCLMGPGEGFSIIGVNRGGGVAATLAKQRVWQRLFVMMRGKGHIENNHQTDKSYLLIFVIFVLYLCI